MKIVHVIYCMGIGGAQTMLVDIMNEQCQKDEVHLIIINNDYSDSLLKEIDKKVHIHKVDRPKGSKNPYYIIKLNILLLKINPNVIHRGLLPQLVRVEYSNIFHSSTLHGSVSSRLIAFTPIECSSVLPFSAYSL